MPPVVRITFPYSAAEHAEAMSGTVSGGRLLRWLRFCALSFPIMGLVTGVLGVAIAEQPLGSVWANLWPFLPLGAFWYWGAPAILDAVHKWQFRREGVQEGRHLETVSIGPDGITPGAKWSHPIPWAQVRRIQETKNLIVIDASTDGPTYLPKHAIAAGDMASFKELLREKFHDRPKDLRLKSVDLALRASG